jgi:hypothetical protein
MSAIVSLSLAAIEERLKRSFGIKGEPALKLDNGAIPVVNVFDCDTVGLHGYTGKRFAGQSQVTNAVGGQGKISLKAHVDLVVESHTLSNLSGAAGTFNLRYAPPGVTDAFAYTENNTFWIEQSDNLAEFIGATNAVSNDASVVGSIIWLGVIPALSSVQINMPVHLRVGSRIIGHQQTTNQITAYSWHGFVL